MKGDYSQLEAIIKKRQEDHARLALEPIMVRDVIVVGEGVGAHGEFSWSAHRNESELSLMDRMLAEIKSLFERGVALHHEDNFIKTPDGIKMRDDKKNAITRLITNEFYFYPDRDHGPIPERAFQRLLAKLEQIGRAAPDNFHVVLASFPVLNLAGEVHNMVVHVQCGSGLRLSVFAKSIPSDTDAEYPNTIMPYFMSGHKSNRLLVKMESAFAHFEKRYQSKRAVVSRKSLEMLRKLVVLVEVEDTKAVLALIDDLLLYPSGRSELVEQFIVKMNSLMLQIEHKAVIARSSAITAVSRGEVKDAKFGMKDDHALPIYYNGIIDCTTFGGVNFTTAIDICLDHSYALSQRMHQHIMKQRIMGSPTIIPTQISQVVTSNTIALLKSSFFGESLAHADPDHVEVMTQTGAPIWGTLYPISSQRWQNAMFGKTSKMSIFPIRPLQRVALEFQAQLERMNAFLRELQRLSMLDQAYPSRDDINQQMKDIRLRMAFDLVDFDKMHALIDDGADLLFQDESGVSTLMLAKDNPSIASWLEKGTDLSHAFAALIEKRDHRRVVGLYKEATKLNLTRKLKPLIRDEIDLSLKVDLFHLAVLQRDAWLMQRLDDLGVSPVYVDPTTGRALYNEILNLDHPRLGLMDKLKAIFVNNVPEAVLLESLSDVDDKDQAKRFMLATAIDKDSEDLFSAVLNLGGDCLGLNPVTGVALLKDIPVRGAVDIPHAMFKHVLETKAVSRYVKLILENDIAYLKIALFMKYIASLPGDQAGLLAEVTNAVIVGNHCRYLSSLRNDKIIFPLIPLPWQQRLTRAMQAYDAFKSALYQDDLVTVQAAIQGGMSVNVKFDDGKTPLILSVLTGDDQLLDFLLMHDPDITMLDNDQNTAVVYAMVTENWAALNRLYQYALKVDVADQVFDRQKLRAIKHSLKLHMTHLIKPGEGCSDPVAELKACSQLALQLGLKLGLKSSFGLGLMLGAIKKNQAEIVVWLLQNGVRVDAVDAPATSFLSLAIQLHANEIASVLIDHGALAAEIGRHSASPFYFALVSDNAEMLGLLIEVNHDDLDLNEIEPMLDKLPLHYAVQYKLLNSAAVLIRHGAVVDLVDPEFDISPLMIAIREHDESMLRLLLSNDANPNLAVENRTPLTYAVKHGKDLDILNVLLAQPKININAQQPGNRRTALHIAVMANKPLMIEALLQKGARVDLKNCYGETPIDVAKNRHPALLELFAGYQNQSVKSPRP